MCELHGLRGRDNTDVGRDGKIIWLENAAKAHLTK